MTSDQIFPERKLLCRVCQRIKFYYYKDFVGHSTIISSEDSKSLIGAHISRTRPFAVIYHISTIIRAYSQMRPCPLRQVTQRMYVHHPVKLTDESFDKQVNSTAQFIFQVYHREQTLTRYTVSLENEQHVGDLRSYC